jgi:tetratricopeptide (TPR) repeat protein
MLLLPLFLLQTATPMSAQPLPTLDEVQFSECLKQAVTDAPSAVTQASEWAQKGGGYLARACHGYALATDFKFDLAVPLLTEAAQGAEAKKDDRAARFWAQAGNAAIAVGEMDVALDSLNKALAATALVAAERADIEIDRARALVILNQNAEAEAALTNARGLASENATAWLLSATLARRENKLPDALGFIQTAAALAPRDPAVALEAGNIAIAAGDDASARKQWEQVVAIAPNSRQATSAKAQLAALGPSPSPPVDGQSR